MCLLALQACEKTSMERARARGKGSPQFNRHVATVSEPQPGNCFMLRFCFAWSDTDASHVVGPACPSHVAAIPESLQVPEKSCQALTFATIDSPMCMTELQFVRRSSLSAGVGVQIDVLFGIPWSTHAARRFSLPSVMDINGAMDQPCCACRLELVASAAQAVAACAEYLLQD